MLAIQEVDESVAPDEPSLAHLDWRLTELEKRFEANTAHIDRRFDLLAAQVASLGHVRADVYASDQRALNEKVDNAHKLAMWAVGLTASTSIGAIVTGILAISGTFAR